MYFVIRLIAWSVWGLVGLILWIPFLIRTMVSFNWSLVYATVTGHHTLLAQARANLDFATSLYVMGFVNIEQWTNANRSQLPAAPQYTAPPDLSRFLFEVLWAALWWGIILFPGVLSETISQIGLYGLGMGWAIFAAGFGLAILLVLIFGKAFKKTAD